MNLTPAQRRLAWYAWILVHHGEIPVQSYTLAGTVKAEPSDPQPQEQV